MRLENQWFYIAEDECIYYCTVELTKGEQLPAVLAIVELN